MQSVLRDNEQQDLYHFADSRQKQEATLAGRGAKSNDDSLCITSVRGDHLVPPESHFNYS